MNVLLATHGRPQLLGRTLVSLLAPENSRFLKKVVVVENGGDWGACELVKSLDAAGRIVFHSIPEANKSIALNAGLALCDEGLVFLTDDDVDIPPATIRAYAEAAKQVGRGYYFGGPTEASYESEPEAWLKEFLPASAKGWPSFPLSESGQWVCMGFNWAAFREDLVAVGGFDPDFGPGSESGSTGQESNMQRRLNEERGILGYFVNDAKVVHEVPAERCSEEWAIRRVRRTYLEKGIVAATLDIKEAAEQSRRRWRRGLLRRARALLSNDPERKFRSTYWDSADSGFAEGVELVRNGES